MIVRPFGALQTPGRTTRATWRDQCQPSGLEGAPPGPGGLTADRGNRVGRPTQQ